MIKNRSFILNIRDILILCTIPLFINIIHLISNNFDFMFDDNLLIFANSYNVIQSISHGEFPLRDPYLYLDLIRMGITSTLYWPYTLYHIVGAVFFSENVEMLRRIWLALHSIHMLFPSIAMYLFLRYLKLSRISALFGGIVYGWNLNTAIFGGIYLGAGRYVHYTIIPIMWILAAHSIKSEKYYLNLLSGVLMGWAFLALGLQPAIYIFPFVLLFLFLGILFKKPVNKKNYFYAFITPILVVVVLSLCISPLLFTVGDILPYLNRSNLPPGQFPISIREFFCGFIEPFISWLNISAMPWETTRYMGIITILFIFVGLCWSFKYSLKNKLSIDNFMLLILLSFFVVFIGYPVMPEWIWKLLLFGKGYTRHPFRLFALATFSLPFFAAKGFECFYNTKVINGLFVKKIFIFSLNIIIYAFLFKILVHNSVIGGTFFFYMHTSIMIISIIYLIILYNKLLPALSSSSQGFSSHQCKASSLKIPVSLQNKNRFLWFGIILLILDLGLVVYNYCNHRFQVYGITHRFNRYEKDFLRVQDKAGLSKLPRQDIPYRIQLFTYVNYSHTGQAERLICTGYLYNKLRNPFGYKGSIGIYNLLHISYYNDMVQKVKNLKIMDHPIYDILGVKYFYFDKKNLEKLEIKTTKSFMLMPNKDSIPLINFVNRLKIFENNKTLFEAVRSGKDEMRNTVYLNYKTCKNYIDNIKKFINREPSSQNIKPEITSVNYRNNKIEINTKSNAESILVLSEPWLPPWTAKVDNRSVNIFRAYGILQAIILPPGIHNIKFEYTYPYYWIFISFISQIVVILFVVYYYKKSTNSNGQNY